MEIINDIVYSILEKKTDGRIVKIRAGKEWTEGRLIKYEGVNINIPAEVKDKKVTFAVLNVKKIEHDSYILHLHSHDFDGKLKEAYEIPKEKEYCYIDSGGDIEVSLNIKIDLLSRWTGLAQRDIMDSFQNKLSLGLTYNLLASIPRKIIVDKKKVIIEFNPHKKIDTYNLCNYIFENRHPIDN